MDKDLNKEILEYLKNQNKKFDDLHKDYKDLLEHPYGVSNSEKLKRAKEESDKYGKELDEVIEKLKGSFINDKRLKEFFKDNANKFNDINTLLSLKNEYEKELNNLKLLSPENRIPNQDVIEEELNKSIELLEKETKTIIELGEKGEKSLSSLIKEQGMLNDAFSEGNTAIDEFSINFDNKTKALRNGFGRIKDGFGSIKGAVEKTLEPWAKAEQAAMSFGRSMGMSRASVQSYLRTTLDFAVNNDIGVLFNKTTDELIGLQNKYSEVVGRNVKLTDDQKISMLSLEKFLGEDGMADIANNLENFGLGMSDSADFIHKTMSEATKHGIAASKLTKTIQENIKMAQNYSFKNGLDGLTSMAKKAIELKTDMSLINGFIDKTSTLEGSITTGAQLQVLGGSYAMGSNPLDMMYESLNDVEGLFDRALKMVEGKVFYNTSTGNFDMSNYDRYIMKQVATTMGIEPSKLIDVAYRNASMSRIENQINANSKINGDEDMVRLVKNLATWDKGKGVVNIDGKDVDIKDINIEDKARLEAMSKTDTQNLTDMALDLRSVKEILSGTVKEGENEQAGLMKDIGENISNILEKYSEILDTIAKINMWTQLISNGIMFFGGGFNTIRGAGNIFKGGKGLIGKRTPTSNTPTPRNGGSSGSTPFYRNISNIKPGLKIGTSAMVASAGLSLINSVINGELKENPGKAIGVAAGSGIGGFIGGALGSFAGPAGTMVGGMIGSALGDWVVRGIADWGKEEKENARKEIAARLKKSTNSHLFSLFEGEDALKGDYNERELKEIELAINDGRLDSTDLSEALLNKIRKNDDLLKMNKHGVHVNVAYANGGILGSHGGILYGKSHSEGGMPILGSNITVEGGEYVVNKESTKRNLPLLEKINNNYTMTALEPLGKQMVVNNHTKSTGSNMPHNKIEMNPISINLSGIIKLDTGNSQVDISREILNNPILITKLTEMLSKEMNKLDFGGYNKNIFKQKFT